MAAEGLRVCRDRWDIKRGGAVGAGQAGATWLEETDEDWVLDTVVTASSSPNGFFPQHTVVIMQFLNWGVANMKFKTEDSNFSTFLSWVISRSVIRLYPKLCSFFISSRI